MTYQMEMPGGSYLRVTVEERKPNCYVCGIEGYVGTQPPEYKPLQNIKAEESNIPINKVNKVNKSDEEYSGEPDEVETERARETSERGEGWDVDLKKKKNVKAGTFTERPVPESEKTLSEDKAQSLL